MIFIKIFTFIKNFILAHPSLVKGWVINFAKEARKNPILIVLLLYIAYNLGDFFFIHKNADFISNVKTGEIQKEMNLALNECGNGATITRVSVGTMYNSNNKTSLFVDTVRSCDKSLVRERDDGTCDLDVRWINRSWKKIHDIEQSTLDLLNSDYVNLSRSRGFQFIDGKPIWLNVFNMDGSVSDEGLALKVIAPELFGILKSSHRSIDQIGVVKVTHPTYKHIVYLFTLSFWYNESGEPEKKCEHNKTNILRGLAKKQKYQLQYK